MVDIELKTVSETSFHILHPDGYIDPYTEVCRRCMANASLGQVLGMKGNLAWQQNRHAHCSNMTTEEYHDVHYAQY